jgi:DNA-binding LacI/PurR family transcriptional regulator
MSVITELPPIALQEPVPIRRQLTDSVRAMIRSGQLKPGTRLPASQELARHWNTDAMTVHRALTPLVKEGLLERHPGSGTFIRQREERLTKVCVYEVGDLTGDGGSPFQLAMLTELRKELLAQGMEPDVWMDPRPEQEKQQPWDALVRAAQQRRIHAVIMPVTGWPQLNWVSKLPVPSAFLSSAQRPNTVHLDLPRMAELCVNALAGQGCRSVGLITSAPQDAVDESGDVHEYVGYHQRLHEAIADCGLRVEKAWIRSPRPDNVLGLSGQEQFGYEQFHALWNLPERPEGLIVDVDTMSQGVVKAMLERQVRVPDQLRVVLSKNKHVDFFCPLPVTWCVTDETALVRALIESVQKQFRGEPCETMYIAPTLSRSPNNQ